jgi:hypothetical protein
MSEPVERSTKIRVLGETWHVPRGFGEAYLHVTRDLLALIAVGRPAALLSEVIDLLALIGYQATVEQVASWDLRRRVEAVVYSATEHARASDSPVRRHPRLCWLPEHPWQGSPQGEGIFAGPGGTPIAVPACLRSVI